MFQTDRPLLEILHVAGFDCAFSAREFLSVPLPSDGSGRVCWRSRPSRPLHSEAAAAGPTQAAARPPKRRVSTEEGQVPRTLLIFATLAGAVSLVSFRAK